ncbi:MAG TPA: hypothetical protein VIG92_08320 [Rhodospirillales bacterium]
MEILIVGIVLLVGVLGVFYLKDRFEAPWLTRFAYHELTMRLVVIAVALIFFGGIMTIGGFFE